jgi:hypothetical protein
MAMKLNGWQRLWIFISVPFVLWGLLLVASGLKELNGGEVGIGLSIAVLFPLFMYAVGWGMAWVRRGFKESK